jgi:hypothetical protein
MTKITKPTLILTSGTGDNTNYTLKCHREDVVVGCFNFPVTRIGLSRNACPNSNIVFGGTGENCSGILSPQLCFRVIVDLVSGESVLNPGPICDPISKCNLKYSEAARVEVCNPMHVPISILSHMMFKIVNNTNYNIKIKMNENGYLLDKSSYGFTCKEIGDADHLIEPDQCRVYVNDCKGHIANITENYPPC